jgi:putative transposase
VHLIRNSHELRVLEGPQGHRPVAAQRLSRRDAEAGLAALDAFEEGRLGPEISGHRAKLAAALGAGDPVLRLPGAVRRIIYTTNAIEALNSKLRRAVRTRGHFPGDEAAMKLLYLVLNHAAEEWKRPPREWFEAKTQFAIIFGDRFTV